MIYGTVGLYVRKLGYKRVLAPKWLWWSSAL